MRVTGQIKDGASGEAITGARVHFEVGSTEATSKTDASGSYQWSDDTSYVGKSLRCRVEKEGYEPRETTLEVDRDRIRLDLELTSTSVKEDEPDEPSTDTIVSMKLRVRNPSGRGVQGARVEVSRGRKPVDSLISGPQGRVVLRVPGSRVGETLEYRVEAEGFEGATGTFPVEAGSEHLVTLERSDAPEPWWKRAWGGFRTALGAFATFAGDLMTAHRAITAVLALAVAGGVGAEAERRGIINLFDGNDDEEALVEEFTVTPEEIRRGEPVRLEWSAAADARVTLDGEPVPATGEAEDRPQETKRYVLEVEMGGRTSRLERRVGVLSPPPEPSEPQIAAFRATPTEIQEGESTVLRWETRNADQVVLSGIGEVALTGSFQVEPSEDTQYVLSVTGGANGTTVRRAATVEVMSAPPPTPPDNPLNALLDEFDIYLADSRANPGKIYRVMPGGSVTERYERSSGRLSSFAVGPDGAIYFLNASSESIFRTDGSTETRVYRHETYVRDLTFDEEGRLYFSEATGAGGDGVIYRLGFGQQTLNAAGAPAPQAEVFQRVPLSQVDGYWSGNFAFDPSGTLYVSSGNRDPARLYEYRNGRFVERYSLDEPFTGFSFVAQDRILFTNHGQTLYLLEDAQTRSDLLTSSRFEWMNGVALGRR